MDTRVKKHPRYVSRYATATEMIEVSFWGGIPGDSNRKNPKDTETRVSFRQSANVHMPNETWIEKWCIGFGSPKMPEGAWNGIDLPCIAWGRLFAGIGNSLLELNRDNGGIERQIDIDNTPVVQVLPILDIETILVRSSYFQFSSSRHRSNILALDPTGNELWSAENPGDDVYANPMHRDGQFLNCSSWSGFWCRIDLSTGSIVEKRFTK